ncbi:MAG: DUF4349 domain-containing protein [Saprospiraceae bacterium]
MTASKLRKISTRSVVLLLIGCFLLTFLLRVAYVLTRDTREEEVYVSSNANDLSLGSWASEQGPLRKNYASEKSLKIDAPVSASEPSQKYEKTATLNARTERFDQEEKHLRSMTSDFNAIIQYENKNGNPGNRSLQLMIGVRPELFDSFYVAAQGVGRIFVNSVVKVDKTTEFRELNAKKASLEKALASLNELKSHAGTISDLVGLHDKILDIERQMQELGVELGNFSAENEFCTVRFALFENAAAPAIPLLSILFKALVWTFEYYIMALIGFAVVLLVALLAITVVGKIGEVSKKD